jgi:hypothetical protein
MVIDLPQPVVVRGSIDRARFPDADAVQASSLTSNFLSFKTKLAADQSTFELRDLPPGSFWISVLGKPVRSGVDGYTTSAQASKRLNLQPGDIQEVHFDAPDPPR